ncbi:MAG TPA: hypothetical protein VJ840_03525 [Gemmatimonadaceae bacterium]|nr:hypothetical protein [Gemmatimonadaceae bacterium]
MWRTIALVLSLLVLTVTGVLGVYNGLTETPTPDQTALQHSVTVGVLLYGALGLVSAYGLFRRQRSSLWTVIAWAFAITYVPGVAVLAYAGLDAPFGAAIAASGVTGLIALGVIWTANVMTKPDLRTTSTT